MKRIIVLIIFMTIGGSSLLAHAEIFQSITYSNDSEFTELYWNVIGNEEDTAMLTGYWQGSLSVSPIDNGFILTYGFSNADGVVIDSGPINFYSGMGQYSIGTTDFNGIRYHHEIDVDVNSPVWAHAYTYVWPEGPAPVVPEPISSILFVTGGTLLAGRRFIRMNERGHR